MRPDPGYFEEARLGKPYDIGLLRRLWPFVRRHRRPLAASIALVVAITLLDLALPYVTKVAIDRFIVPPPAKTAGQPPGRRMLRLALEDPRVAEVARRYPQLVTVEAGAGWMRYEDLARVSPADRRLLRAADLRGLAVVTAAFLALALASFAFNYLQKLIMETTGHRIMHDLRLELFAHIASLSIDFFTRNPVGRLVTRTTNDVQNMHELFTSFVSFVFKDLFLLAGIALVMVTLNWELALVCFAVLPLVGLAAFVFARRAREVFRRLRVLVAEINTRFAEMIGGIRVLQLFGRQEANYRRFEELNHENYLAGMRQIHVLAIFMPLINVLALATMALAVYHGGHRVLLGELSLGALVAFFSYIRMFFHPIRDLAEKYNILQNAMASAERIFLIMDTESRLQMPPPSAARLPLAQIEEIRLEQVWFGYRPGEPVLRDIDLTIRRGQTVALVGPTGAGKTSLVNLIPRFYDPTSGRVTLNGRNLADWDPAAYRSKMALVMQDPFLFSGSIGENIFEGRRAPDAARVREVLAAARLDDMLARYPEGLETRVTEGGATLSSGERQLISIARALARDPQLILLDEATSHIDSQTEQRIQTALAALMRGRTAVVVAHRLSTVRQADVIVVLNRGRIIETGTHAELMAAGGFYCRLQRLENAVEDLRPA